MSYNKAKRKPLKDAFNASAKRLSSDKVPLGLQMTVFNLQDNTDTEWVAQPPNLDTIGTVVTNGLHRVTEHVVNAELKMRVSFRHASGGAPPGYLGTVIITETTAPDPPVEIARISAALETPTPSADMFTLAIDRRTNLPLPPPAGSGTVQDYFLSFANDNMGAGSETIEFHTGQLVMAELRAGAAPIP